MSIEREEGGRGEKEKGKKGKRGGEKNGKNGIYGTYGKNKPLTKLFKYKMKIIYGKFS